MLRGRACRIICRFRLHAWNIAPPVSSGSLCQEKKNKETYSPNSKASLSKMMNTERPMAISGVCLVRIGAIYNHVSRGPRLERLCKSTQIPSLFLENKVNPLTTTCLKLEPVSARGVAKLPARCCFGFTGSKNVTSGLTQMPRFEPTHQDVAGNHRGFCNCGSCLFFRRKTSQFISLAVGCFDRDAVRRYGTLLTKAGSHLYICGEIARVTDHLEGERFETEPES